MTDLIFDYLWLLAATVLTVTLAVKHYRDIKRENQRCEERNAQKIFHMNLQLPDRLKMDLNK